jgi:hypothetical protein
MVMPTIYMIAIFQMEIGKKTIPDHSPQLPDYTSPFNPSEKVTINVSANIFQHQKLVAIEMEHSASTYPITASQQGGRALSFFIGCGYSHHSKKEEKRRKSCFG